MVEQIAERLLHTNLVDLLRYRALVQPDTVLYTYLADGESQQVSITAAELDRRASAVALRLLESGHPPESAILLYPPGNEFIVGFMGCLYAGVIAIPAFPPHLRRPSPRLEAIVQDSGAEVALSTENLLLDLSNNRAHLTHLTKLRWIATDTIQADGSYCSIPCSGDKIAFLQYTSGSTGNPKGVIVTHGNLLHNMSLIAKYYQLNAATKIVNWLPAFHDMGLIGQLLMALTLGCELVFMSPVNFMQKPIRWLRAITQHKGTYSGGPNFAYELCAQKFNPELDSDIDLSSWELAFNGAEPVREETLRKFIKTFEPYGFQPSSLVPSYGLAEGTLYVSGFKRELPYTAVYVDAARLQEGVVVQLNPGDPSARKIVACGRVVEEQQVVIAEPDVGEIQGDGVIGEICVSGPSVAKGYWKDTLKTAATFKITFPQHPGLAFMRTGDLGFILNGELFITGRRKDVLIVCGCNHYPQDIEHTVQKAHPAVRMDYIAAFQHQEGEAERVIVVAECDREYRPRAKSEAELASLTAQLKREVLAAARKAVTDEHELFLHDVVLIRTGTIPKTSSGKIQRQMTKQLYETNQLELI